MQKYLSWVEISRNNLTHNIKEFKNKVGKTVLCPCVKANAYGHGLIETARIFVEAGADWLSVNALYEAENLREAGIQVPIYIMGYTLLLDLKRAWELDCRLVVYSRETIEKLGEIASEFEKPEFEKPINLHIKVETGNNRQGVKVEELVDFANFILQKGKGKLKIEGLATHFANIEDTTDHTYAFGQLTRFLDAKRILEEAKIPVPMMHCANSAATILYPETYLDMVRVGISAYGMWPSKETFVSFQNLNKNGFELKPAFTWKSVVGQIKTVSKNDFIGYGCSFRAMRDTVMAIVPVGYYDGYDRKLSNNAHVLVHGQRAKVLGRVCMNMIMVDVTDITDVRIEDEVVLIGAQKCEGASGNISSDNISVEEFAGWIGTINYEATTRVNERIPRIVVE